MLCYDLCCLIDELGKHAFLCSNDDLAFTTFLDLLPLLTNGFMFLEGWKKYEMS
ncbi:hypothetical protein JHK82_053135 [Glycine max]|nr:hypothetical protein JHK86_052981 [Glycine max]KAG4927354.1 hypothetical protein JHK85_053840 [Glycine max]KAG5082970.1 hypothetical protein JHK84_053008 [Glycine max]KAG5085738.1 hypothetical protein JHK82_053135 [Glycine max]